MFKVWQKSGDSLRWRRVDRILGWVIGCGLVAGFLCGYGIEREKAAANAEEREQGARKAEVGTDYFRRPGELKRSIISEKVEDRLKGSGIQRFKELESRLSREMKPEEWREEFKRMMKGRKGIVHDWECIYFFSRWLESDAVSAMAALAELGDSFHYTKYRAINEFCYRNPEEAWKLFENKVEPFCYRRDTPGAIIRGLARQDPEKAWERMQGLGGGKQKQGQLLNDFIIGLSETAPDRISDYIARVDKANWSSFQVTMLHRWAQVDMSSLKNWLDNYPEGEGNSARKGQYLTAIAREDLAWAQEEARSLNSRERQDFVSEYAPIIANEQGFLAAMEFAWEASKGGEGWVPETLMSSWSRQKSADAAAWVNSLAAGKEKDAVMLPYISGSLRSPDLAASDLRNLASQIGGIQDSEIRLRALEHVIDRYQAVDPHGAESYINNYKGTEAEIRYLKENR